MLESAVKSTSTETLSDLIGSGVLWAGAESESVAPGALLLVVVAGVSGVASGALFVVSGAKLLASASESGAGVTGTEVVLVAVVDADAVPAAETVAEPEAFALSASAMRCLITSETLIVVFCVLDAAVSFFEQPVKIRVAERTKTAHTARKWRVLAHKTASWRIAHTAERGVPNVVFLLIFLCPL